MSDEMKPVAWIDALALPPPEHISGTYLFSEKKGDATLALYTADQLAEAVAKERKRCAKVCDAPASEAVGFTRDILRVVACTIRTGTSA